MDKSPRNLLYPLGQGCDAPYVTTVVFQQHPYQKTIVHQGVNDPRARSEGKQDYLCCPLLPSCVSSCESPAHQHVWEPKCLSACRKGTGAALRTSRPPLQHLNTPQYCQIDVKQATGNYRAKAALTNHLWTTASVFTAGKQDMERDVR